MLSRSSLLAALADVQRMYFDCVAEDDAYMAHLWEQEMDRIHTLLENHNG